jgi:uncharacterized membrane protein YecN with MAPEG domain
MLILETGGTAPWVVHTLGAMLVLGRLAHAWSFSVARLRLVSRVAGMTLTVGMLGLAAVLCLLHAFGFA